MVDLFRNEAASQGHCDKESVNCWSAGRSAPVIVYQRGSYIKCPILFGTWRVTIRRSGRWQSRTTKSCESKYRRDSARSWAEARRRSTVVLTPKWKSRFSFPTGSRACCWRRNDLFVSFACTIMVKSVPETHRKRSLPAPIYRQAGRSAFRWPLY